VRLLHDNDGGDTTDDEQAAAKAVRQGQHVGRGWLRDVRHIEHQHNRARIADEIRERCGDQRQGRQRLEM